MNIQPIIKRIKKESREFTAVNKAVDGWILIPEHLLAHILTEEVTRTEKSASDNEPPHNAFKIVLHAYAEMMRNYTNLMSNSFEQENLNTLSRAALRLYTELISGTTKQILEWLDKAPKEVNNDD